MEAVWTDITAVLEAPVSDTYQVGQIIDLVLDMLADRTPDFANDRQCMAMVSQGAQMLVQSEVFSAHALFCRRRLVSLFTTKSNATRDYLLVLGLALLYDSHYSPEALNLVVHRSAVSHILETIWHHRVDDFKVLRVYIDLMFRTLLGRVLTLDDLDGVQDSMIHWLFTAIRDGHEVMDDCLQLLLALNDQYMTLELENKVFDILCRSGNEYRAVGSQIVMLANRTSNSTIQLLLVKLLYLLFTIEDTYDFLYLNDLKVLVDVFIRELSDLDHDPRNMRNMYLRVLQPLLENTPIGIDHYKRGAIVCVLRSTLDWADGETKRLAQQCLDVEWLAWSRNGSVSSLQSTLSDMSSISSIVVEVPPLPSIPDIAGAPASSTIRIKPLPPPPRRASGRAPPPPPPRRAC